MDYNILLFVIGIILMFSKKYRNAGIIIILSGLMVLLVVNALKYGIGRPRPFEMYPIELLINAPTSPSFPSTHAAGSAVLVSLAYLYKKYDMCLLATVFLVLISFSRMYLFVHYPSDVIAGVIVGFICSYITFILIGKLVSKRQPGDVKE